MTMLLLQPQQIGFDRYGHTDTNTDTDMVIPICSKLIPIPILPSIIYIKPIPISGLKFISNQYRYDFILADTDTDNYYRYRYRLYRLSLLQVEPYNNQKLFITELRLDIYFLRDKIMFNQIENVAFLVLDFAFFFIVIIIHNPPEIK